MKKRYILFIFIICFVFTANLSVSALDLTARSLGMGGTFTGIADEVNTVIYNPAGITQAGSLGFNINGGVQVSEWNQYSELIEKVENIDKDLQNNDIADLYYSFPDETTIRGQLFLGGNVNNFAISHKTEKNIVNVNNKLKVEDTSKNILTYGREVLTPYGDLGALSYGLNLKFLDNEIVNYNFDINEENNGEDQLTKIETSGRGIGVDTGLLLKLTDLVQVGMQIRDIYTPDYRAVQKKYNYNIDDSQWYETEEETKIIPTDPELRAGASVEIPLLNARIAGDIDNFTSVFNNNQKTVYHLGFEKHILLRALTLRGGYIDNSENQYYTAGLGVNLYTLEVNTALAADNSFQDDYMFVLSGKMQF